MSDLITIIFLYDNLLSMYVYQVFGLANLKALMQTGEIKFITVLDVYELSSNVVLVLLFPLCSCSKAKLISK